METISATEHERRAAQSQLDIGRKLATPAAAAHCGVSKSYLDKLRCLGGGPIFHKIGRRVVYTIGDLDTWLDGCRRGSTSDNSEAA